MTTALIFIAILSLLVFVHELGHFLMAKRNGIAVEEFGMGLPPRLWGKKYGETLISINALPIGGFVRLRGEDSTDEKLLKDPRSFASKPTWVRMQVLLAGVVANFALGMVLLTFVFSIGVPEFSEHPLVQEVLVDTAAQQAGLQIDDEIISVDGVEVLDTTQLTEKVMASGDRSVKLKIRRGESVLDYEIAPQEGRLGVVITNFRMVRYPLGRAALEGLKASYTITGALLSGLGDFVHTLITQGQMAQGISGPVGIAQMTSQARQLGFQFLLQFAGILSINLAIINILPFPALDGGRLIFVFAEMVTGHRVSPNFERLSHLIGMLLLLLLLLFVTVQDVGRFFTN